MRTILFIALSVFLFACGDDTPTQADQFDEFANNNPEVVLDSTTSDSGRLFYFQIESAGSAEKPTVSNSVNVNYVGAYTDGEIFDANDDISFPLSGVIEGWQAGIPLIGKNGRIKLVIPPDLGYGPNPNNGIRKNAVLVFDVDLLDFN